ncbi:MAG: flagellar hook-associated protein FlgL [bacterium]
MRITRTMLSRTFLSTINQSGARLARTQEELASGKKILRASDDPAGASRVLAGRSRLAKLDTLARNTTRTIEDLSTIENALSEATSLIGEARQLALQASNPPITAADREAAAAQVDSILTRLVAIANLNDGERYLFAGEKSLTKPFTLSGTGATYSGDAATASGRIHENEDVELLVPGLDAFGVLPAQVGDDADLDPDIWEFTKLTDLNNGDGVALTQIQITDGNGASQTVSLVGAETVGDVITRINDAGLAVTASINGDGNGISLAGSGTLSTFTIAEVGDGIAAYELGLRGEWDGTAPGSDLDPIVSSTTPLALLRGGLGVTPAAIHVENKIGDQLRMGDVDLSFARSVGDLIVGLRRAQSSSGEDLLIEGVVNDAGTGITIRSRAPLSTLGVTNVSGSTMASELGTAGASGPVTLFDVVASLRDALRADDVETVRASLEPLDAALDQNLVARIDVGSRVRRVEAAQSNLEARSDLEKTAISEVEDVDFAEAVVRSSEEQIAYQAALAATSRAVSVSLLDFLR